MLEFENLVYLDLQKTGSRFIVRFLRRFVAAPEIAHSNGLPRAERKDGALHIISCRHPLSHYLSLYSYGCTGKGGLRTRMEREIPAGDLARLYEGTAAGFVRWLELMLSPASRYAGDEMFGFQTARFLMLALPGYKKILRRAETTERIKEQLLQLGMMDVVLKQETLNDDLLKLVAGEHGHIFKDRDDVPAYLVETPRINTSKKLDIDPSALPRDILSTLRAREWLLFDVLGFV